MTYLMLPVEPIEGMTSEERAVALDTETWRLMRPASIQFPGEVTQTFWGHVYNGTQAGFWVVAEEQVYISPEVDLTNLLALLPEVPQSEKNALVSYIEANENSYVPFENLVPSTSTQLSEYEAVELGWPPPLTPE